MALTDSEYRKEKARVKKAFLKWSHWLGFRGWTDCTCEYWRDYLTVPAGEEDREGNYAAHQVAASCDADWKYLTCRLRVSCQHTKNMDDKHMEGLIVHELCHALVNEMREGGIDHEERVVTQLQQAFCWVEILSSEVSVKKKR